MLNEKKMHENRRTEMLEAYLADSFTFSLRETAKMLGRSVRWVREKTASGKLRFDLARRAEGASPARPSSKP